ncbi:MAG: SDR family NAD(P)-dependent oxidoreductase, partial [Mycobacteriaceae bacterium]
TAPFWKRPVSDWDTLIGIGLRAHYVSCVEAAKIMVPQGSGLMANISSFGSRGYLHSVLYGMSKTGLDKMAADMAVDLKGTGVTAVSLWLGLVQTERVRSLGDSFQGFSIADAEEPEYVGRVINTLAQDPALGEYNGHTLVTAEYGSEHGLTNSDGRQPPSHRPFFGGGPLFPPPSS